MGEREAKCPRCGSTVSVTVWGFHGMHINHHRRVCPGSHEPAVRPTILTFHGETGEDDCGAESRWVWQENEYYAKWLHPNGDTWTDSAPGCPAPTPEA